MGRVWIIKDCPIFWTWVTLKNYKSVSERVSSSLRNEHLSFNHHKEVAAIPEEKQIEFLDRASEEKLSVRELRKVNN